jgi:hypothetical protein
MNEQQELSRLTQIITTKAGAKNLSRYNDLFLSSFLGQTKIRLARSKTRSDSKTSEEKEQNRQLTTINALNPAGEELREPS